MIKRIELGNTGVMLSQYTLGTMLMGSAMSEVDSHKVLNDYVLKKGGNFLDTSNNYAWWIGSGQCTGDESELLVGNWVKENVNREDVFIATKVGANWIDNRVLREDDGTPKYGEWIKSLEGASEKVIRQGLEESLKKLQTDYIDLYYIHVDDRNTPLEETLRTMDALVKEGKIRYIGYSNVQTWRIERIFNICEKYSYEKPVIIQQEYAYINPAKYIKHDYANHAKEDFFDWIECTDGVSLTAYSPLLKGIFVNEERRKEWLGSREYDTSYTKNRLNTLLNVAKEMAVSPNALALAWMANKKEKIFPILGFSKIEQYEENIACINIEITKEVMRELN